MVPQVPCVGCGVMGSPTCLGPVRWPPTVKVSVLGEGSPLTRYVNLSSAHSEPRQAHASTVPRRHAHSRAVWLFQIRLTRSRGNTPGTSCRLTTMNHLEPSALGHSAPGSHSTRATRRRCPARPLRLCGRSEPTRGAGLRKCHPPGTPCHLALHSPQAMFVSSAQRHRTIRRGLSPCLRVCPRRWACAEGTQPMSACVRTAVRVQRGLSPCVRVCPRRCACAHACSHGESLSHRSTSGGCPSAVSVILCPRPSVSGHFVKSSRWEHGGWG